MRQAPPADALLEVLQARWEESPIQVSAEHLARLREHLLRTLPREALSPFAPQELRATRVRRSIQAFLRQRRSGLPPTAEVVQALYAETAGLGPLEGLLAEPSISEIVVQRWDSLLVERDGVLETTPVRFRSADHLESIVQRLVLLAGRSISPSQPLVSFAWQDGSRIQATVPPVSPEGPTLTLRRYRQRRFSLPDLVRLGTLSEAQAQRVTRAMAERETILVSGPVSSGKTTLLETLIGVLPAQPPVSVLLIEDVPEIHSTYPHTRRLVVPASDGQLSLRELVHAGLRMRPDLVVIGETRGPEAADLVYALSAGLPGGLTSIHAASPPAALRRLAHYVQMDPHNPFARMPELLQRILADSIQLVLQMTRMPTGERRLSSMARVAGYDDGRAEIRLEEVRP